MTLLLLLMCVPGPQGDLDDARLAMEKACAKAHKDLADWCVKQKLHSAARKHYEEALRFTPADSGLRKKATGDVPEDAPKDPEKAAKALRKKEDQLTKALVKARSGFAKTADRLKEDSFAAFQWMKVLSIDPKNSAARRALGKDADKRMEFFAQAGKIEYDLSEFEESDRDGRFDRALLHYTELLPAALEKVERGTGLRWNEDVPLRVVFSNEKAAGTGQLAATTINRDHVVIRVTVQNWTSNRPKDSFQFNVTHELTHAVHGSRTGVANYLACPPWFLEGLAEYVSGGGPNMVKYALELKQNQVNGILDGLETDSSAPLGADDYAEGYLAIRYLREKYGEEAFSGLLESIFSAKKKVTDAVLEMAGESWEEFQKSVHAYARRRCAQIVKEARPTGK